MAFLDETGLVELWALIQAEDSKGTKVATGTYSSTYSYGVNNQTQIELGFKPKFFAVMEKSTARYVMIWVDGAEYGLCLYSPNGLSIDINSGSVNSAKVVVTATSSGISWYSTSNSETQLNYSDYVYQYIAIG